jgi:hypothetical protein
MISHPAKLDKRLKLRAIPPLILRPQCVVLNVTSLVTRKTNATMKVIQRSLPHGLNITTEVGKFATIEPSFPLYTGSFRVL